ncbi:MAG TPA: glycosyltransferase family 4 protein [Polyangiales bacterium]|nr:glycosyltransferase family 4 protein [Polyangiales bacterium]
MKVALLSPGWPPSACANGIVTYVSLLQQGLRRADVDSRILAASVKADKVDANVVDLAGCAHRFPRIQDVVHRVIGRLRPHELTSFLVAGDVMRGLRDLEPDFSPDLLEMEESFGSAGRVAKRSRIPVVTRLHGPWFLNGAALGAPRDEAFRHRVASEGAAIANAKALTSPCQDLLDRVRQQYGLELAHGRVIPNPAPEVDASLRWKLSASDPDLLLFVGRFDRHKGGDLVIDAFAELAAKRPRLKLTFIGPDRGLEDGQGRTVGLPEYLSERLPDRSVRSRIQHLGQMPADQIPEWRRKARVTIVASRFEVFPMVVLEALAFGSPLVAASAGGIPEMVTHEENGLSFENGDAHDLANRLELMLDRPDFAAKLGEQAARDAEVRFGPDAIARRMKAYYEGVLAENLR